MIALTSRAYVALSSHPRWGKLDGSFERQPPYEEAFDAGAVRACGARGGGGAQGGLGL